MNWENVQDWSAAAHANLDGALKERVAKSPALDLTALRAVSTEEMSAIDEFVADLGQQELSELQVIEVSTDAQLVGQPS